MRVLFVSLTLLCASAAHAQQSVPAADTLAAPDSAAVNPRRGSEFLIPAGSLFLPGLGQYVHGETKPGLAFSATTVAGYALSGLGDPWGDTWDGDFPRRAEDQFAEVAFDVAFTAGALSAFQAFHAAVPGLRSRGKYGFLEKRESVGDLLSAPFDTRFLRRWTTWVDLAQTIAVTALVVADRDRDGATIPFRGHDAGYASFTSMNAAVSEEALFRGWMLPALYQNTGGKFWLANGIQAGVFGAAHLPGASWYAAVIGGWAAWEGWIVKRNGWSIRESIFHHFWYDTAVITAAMLTEKEGTEIRLSFPTIRF